MLNHIVLMGRIARDIELRHTQAGTAVTSFTLAVDRDVKGRDGHRETDWIDVVAWRGTAEFVSRYLGKGRMVAVEGRLQVRDWTDKDGNKRRTAEVVAGSIYFADSKRSDAQSADERSDAQSADESYMPPEVERPTGDLPPEYSDDSELPF